MLDRLPLELLANVASNLGVCPDALRTCKTTWRLYNDTTTLTCWLERTFGATGAILTFTSIRCVATWPEARVLAAMQQMVQNGCNLGDTTQAGCVLYWATKRGMANVLDLLLTKFSPAWLDSLLKTAAAQGHHGCVSVLLSKGADPNVDGGRPLKAATEAASVECVRALLDAGADVHAGGECALRLCAAAGSPAHMQVMALLLQRGADVHAKADEALSLAVERSNAEAVALLLQHGANASARQVLETAASTGCAKVVRLLLSHGAPPDAGGGRPLRAAAEAGALEVVRQLLDAGARCGNSGTSWKGGLAGRGGRIALARPSLEVTAGTRIAGGSSGAADPGSTPGELSWHSSWDGSSEAVDGGLVGLGAVAANSIGKQPVPGVCACGQMAADRDVDVFQVEVEEEHCPICQGAWADVHEEEDLGVEEEQMWDDDGGCYGAGGAALHAALCAGEAEVARVLLERGARVDLATLRCWRQWHRYPGVMAVLQRHRPLGCSSASAAAAAQQVRGSNPGHARPAGMPPLASSAGTSSHLTSNRPAGLAGSWGVPMGAVCCAPSWMRARGSNCAAYGSGDGCALFCMPAIQQQLREALVSAAGEGAEAAVQLFLTWGAPRPPINPLTAITVQQHTSMDSSGASSYSDSDNMRSNTGGNQPCTAVPGACLGLFTPECLSTALAAAAAANRPVVVRQLLQHCPEPAWARAILHPSALHVAVSDGYVEVVRLLLSAGVADVALRPACLAPNRPRPSSSDEGSSLRLWDTDAPSNTSPVPSQALLTAPAIPTQPSGVQAPAWNSLSLASIVPALPPIGLVGGVVTSSGLLLGVGHEPARPISTVPIPSHSSSNRSGAGSIAAATAAAVPVPIPASINAKAAIPHLSTGVALLASEEKYRVSPPPPPLQAEAWGTVVLCAAAGCKAGSKAAAVVTNLLLEHGFGLYAKGAMRLVACGRVPTWRDDAAAAILAAAFDGPSMDIRA